MWPTRIYQRCKYCVRCGQMLRQRGVDNCGPFYDRHYCQPDIVIPEAPELLEGEKLDVGFAMLKDEDPDSLIYVNTRRI